MSLDFPKVEFLRRIEYYSQDNFVYRKQNDDEYKKNILFQEINDSFENKNLSKEKEEIRLKTFINGILGCALGCFVAKKQNALTKTVVSILGALSAIIVTIMYYANKLKKGES